jgi:micrococcal nuclease
LSFNNNLVITITHSTKLTEMHIPVRSYLILVSGLIAVLMVGCSESSGDIDALVSTSVAETIGAQSNSEQQPPVSDGPPQTSIYCPDCQLVEVTGVVDGDTIDTSIGRVRFFGVDTPERGEECFTEATEFTRLMVGRQVRLEDGPRLEDTYGRRLAYAFDSSGNSIDVQLIDGGFAEAWTRDGQHKDVLIGLEESARSNNAGCLWSASDKTSMIEVIPQLGTIDPIVQLADFIFSQELATTHVFGITNTEGDEVYIASGRLGLPTRRNTTDWFAEELDNGGWIVDTGGEIYRVHDSSEVPDKLWP